MANPVPPTTDSVNGALVSVSGKLKAINNEWVVITGGGEETWVPRDIVLLIQLSR